MTYEIAGVRLFNKDGKEVFVQDGKHIFRLRYYRTITNGDEMMKLLNDGTKTLRLLREDRE